MSETKSDSNWVWVVIIIIGAAWALNTLSENNESTSSSRAVLAMDKQVRIKQDSWEEASFDVKGRQRVRLEVKSLNGVPVDFFIAPAAQFTENIYNLNPKKQGVYLKRDEVLSTTVEATIVGNGRYTLGVRHADGVSKSWFSAEKAPAAVHLKFYFL
jgi:hypothetical protein